jgi:TRAP-type C4-dicarboxylate transport system permease small subunit
MPVIWVEEVANMLYVWIVFLGAAMTFREGTMVKMDFLYDVLPKPVQKVFHILFNVIIVTTSILLIPKAYSFLVKISRVDTMVLKISWAYLFWPGLFIVVAMAVIGSMKIIKEINQLRR